jgi:hypothetical protein
MNRMLPRRLAHIGTPLYHRKSLTKLTFEVREVIERDPYPEIETLRSAAYVFARKSSLDKNVRVTSPKSTGQPTH